MVAEQARQMRLADVGVVGDLLNGDRVADMLVDVSQRFVIVRVAAGKQGNVFASRDIYEEDIDQALRNEKGVLFVRFQVFRIDLPHDPVDVGDVFEHGKFFELLRKLCQARAARFHFRKGKTARHGRDGQFQFDVHDGRGSLYVQAVKNVGIDNDELLRRQSRFPCAVFRGEGHGASPFRNVHDLNIVVLVHRHIEIFVVLQVK